MDALKCETCGQEIGDGQEKSCVAWGGPVDKYVHRFDSGCIAALRQVLQHCLLVVDEKNREYIKALVRTVPGAWPKCQHEGCTEDFDGVLVACYFPNYDTDGVDQSQGCPPDEWYCPQHAPAHGYCALCGEFWGGIETFDMNPNGLCDHCEDALKEPEYESDGYDCDGCENDEYYNDHVGYDEWDVQL